MGFKMNRPIIQGTNLHKASVAKAKAKAKQIVQQSRIKADPGLVTASQLLGQAGVDKAVDFKIKNRRLKFFGEGKKKDKEPFVREELQPVETTIPSVSNLMQIPVDSPEPELKQVDNNLENVVKRDRFFDAAEKFGFDTNTTEGVLLADENMTYNEEKDEWEVKDQGQIVKIPKLNLKKLKVHDEEIELEKAGEIVPTSVSGSGTDVLDFIGQDFLHDVDEDAKNINPEHAKGDTLLELQEKFLKIDSVKNPFDEGTDEHKEFEKNKIKQKYEVVTALEDKYFYKESEDKWKPNVTVDDIFSDVSEIKRQDKLRQDSADSYGVRTQDVELGEDGNYYPIEGAKNKKYGDTWDAEKGEWRDDGTEVFYAQTDSYGRPLDEAQVYTDEAKYEKRLANAEKNKKFVPIFEYHNLDIGKKEDREKYNKNRKQLNAEYEAHLEELEEERLYEELWEATEGQEDGEDTKPINGEDNVIETIKYGPDLPVDIKKPPLRKLDNLFEKAVVGGPLQKNLIKNGYVERKIRENRERP
jgi:hypothetical protein|tara:strand:+ start:566 stop:2146 length:1581 start_codon:yes stop_codon:yes gene_type:complete